MAPTSQMRVLRELELPGDDEGFASVERVPFERVRREGRPGVLVAAAVLTAPSGPGRRAGRSGGAMPPLRLAAGRLGGRPRRGGAAPLGHRLRAGRAGCLPARLRATRLLVPPAAPGAAARLRPRARRRPCTVDPDRHVERAPHARGNARRALRRGLRGGWQRCLSTPTRGGDRERREQREERSGGEQADPDPQHESSSAPMERSDDTPRDPSVFIRTKRQSPSSGSQSSVCSPAPDACATQKVCSPGGPAGVAPTARS